MAIRRSQVALEWVPASFSVSSASISAATSQDEAYGYPLRQPKQQAYPGSSGEGRCSVDLLARRECHILPSARRYSCSITLGFHNYIGKCCTALLSKEARLDGEERIVRARRRVDNRPSQQPFVHQLLDGRRMAQWRHPTYCVARNSTHLLSRCHLERFRAHQLRHARGIYPPVAPAYHQKRLAIRHKEQRLGYGSNVAPYRPRRLHCGACAVRQPQHLCINAHLVQCSLHPL